LRNYTSALETAEELRKEGQWLKDYWSTWQQAESEVQGHAVGYAPRTAVEMMEAIRRAYDALKARRQKQQKKGKP
jgi:hypothetical protein